MRLFMMFCVMLLLAGCDTRTSVERAQEEGVLIVGNNTVPQSFDPHRHLRFRFQDHQFRDGGTVAGGFQG